MMRERGFTLPEILVVLLVLGIGVAVSVPAVARMRSEARTAAAAREVAVSFQALRWKSVVTARSHGWFFEQDGSGWFWSEVRDGNGNGLRSAEIRDGTDQVLAGPFRLSERVQGVDPGFPDELPVRRIPPGAGWLSALGDPIKFGRSNVISFAPTGSSSSGTLYLTDGAALFAVVLFGPTARIRIWSYDTTVSRWRR